MQVRYKVKSTAIHGDIVKIILQRDDIVQEKDTFNPFDITKMGKEGIDFEQIMKQSQKLAIKMTNEDSITVPYEEWKKNKIKTDDFITIDVNKETVDVNEEK